MNTSPTAAVGERGPQSRRQDGLLREGRGRAGRGTARLDRRLRERGLLPRRGAQPSQHNAPIRMLCDMRRIPNGAGEARAWSTLMIPGAVRPGELRGARAPAHDVGVAAAHTLPRGRA
jgi:hypothetical protein